MTCFQKNLSNGTIEVLEEDNCTQEKPEVEEECEAENPCGSVDWLVTDWSGCPETCGKNKSPVNPFHGTCAPKPD